VTNLPFSLKDEGLLAQFNEFNAKSAHVVFNRNGRSKGFGFVEFNTEPDQTNALASKKTVEERLLIIKIALTPTNPPSSSSASTENPAQPPPSS